MPLTFAASDQGFPGVIAGGEGECLKSVRIEDGDLHKITDLFICSRGDWPAAPSFS